MSQRRGKAAWPHARRTAGPFSPATREAEQERPLGISSEAQLVGKHGRADFDIQYLKAHCADKGYIRYGCANGCFRKFQPLVIAFPRLPPFIIIPDVVSQHSASGVVFDPAGAQVSDLPLRIPLPARRGSNPE